MKVVVILLTVGLLIVGLLYFNEMQNAKWDELYRNNRTAMKEAIEKALKKKPSIQDLLKEDRRRPRHMYFNQQKGAWEF